MTSVSSGQTAKAYQDYYSHFDGPIGGWERFRWVAETFFGVSRGQRLLEIGCGEGSLLEILSQTHQASGVDISASGIEKARNKGLDCYCADASVDKLSYGDGTFDAVICLEVIEHVENPHHLVWQVKRLLKDGGTFLVSIPGPRVGHPYIYPGLFEIENFREFLEGNAFEVRQIRGWGQAPLLASWVKKNRSRTGWRGGLAAFFHYLGRKRNLLLKKLPGTPLEFSHCVHYECVSRKSGLSRVEEVAAQTRPD